MHTREEIPWGHKETYLNTVDQQFLEFTKENHRGAIFQLMEISLQSLFTFVKKHEKHATDGSSRSKILELHARMQSNSSKEYNKMHLSTT